MSTTIDVYEFKEELKKYEDADDEWIEFPDYKRVGMVTVGDPNIPKEIQDKLKEFDEGDKILVIIQG